LHIYEVAQGRFLSRSAACPAAETTISAQKMLATPHNGGIIQSGVHFEKQKPRRLPYAAQRPGAGDFIENLQQATRASVEFLKTDLETALTFSGIALTTENPGKRTRMRQNARKAYDTVIRFMKRLELTDGDSQSLSGYLQRLKTDLVALGEDLS
jgi:hypothetical protein